MNRFTLFAILHDEKRSLSERGDEIWAEVERLRGALEEVRRRIKPTDDGRTHRPNYAVLEEIISRGLGASPPSAAPGPGTGMEPGPRDCPTGEGHKDNGTGECTNCGALRADEPCKHGITGPCRACAATPGPLPVARLDPVTVRAVLDELKVPVAERLRFIDCDLQCAGGPCDACVRPLAGQAVPVEVDPVEAILAVECPDCTVAAGCPCYMRRQTNPRGNFFCADRIRRASRTTTKAELTVKRLRE